jgi:hypothetical protein
MAGDDAGGRERAWGRPAVLTLSWVVLLAGCVSVTHVRGPDGTDTWFSVACSGPRTGCYEAAAEQCPEGYIIADSASTSSTFITGSHGSVTGFSTNEGNLLIQCKTDRPSRSVQREEAQEAALAPVRDTTRCQQAYRHVEELAARWAEWFQGEAAAKAPKPSAFERVCMALDEDMQLCLTSSYASGHGDACLAKFEALPDQTRKQLDALLLRE